MTAKRSLSLTETAVIVTVVMQPILLFAGMIYVAWFVFCAIMIAVAAGFFAFAGTLNILIVWACGQVLWMLTYFIIQKTTIVNTKNKLEKYKIIEE